MRVQASLQFSCVKTGRNLETQLSTETRNLVIFRRSNVPMRCAFCARRHYWRLIKYHRPDMKHRPGPRRDTAHCREAARDVMTSEMLTAAKPSLAATAKAKVASQPAIATSR
jgi:hypothetical protein